MEGDTTHSNSFNHSNEPKTPLFKSFGFVEVTEKKADNGEYPTKRFAQLTLNTSEG